MHILSDIAEKYGTPCYVYFRETIEKNFKRFQENFQHVHYAVKANSNLAVLNILAKLDAGFDIVSLGELRRVLKAGGKPEKIVFSGVGKQDVEVQKALEAGIACFNIESFYECNQIQKIAQSINKIAPVAFRVNPDISIQTHPYIATGLKDNKFGVAYEDALSLYRYAQTLSYLHIKGIACHLGSQIMEEAPYLVAVNKLLALIRQLRQENIRFSHLDIGGGFGVDYQQQKSMNIQRLADKIHGLLIDASLKLIVEPGRAIVADSGILLTRVISLKSQSGKHFAIVDAAMNDLLRPALYDAWHDIVPVMKQAGKEALYDIVGPVCETGDFFAKDRRLCLQGEDLLAITMAGAYGFVMSSNYNSRPRPPEILVDKDQHYLIRERETLEDLMDKERCLLLD